MSVRGGKRDIKADACTSCRMYRPVELSQRSHIHKHVPVAGIYPRALQISYPEAGFVGKTLQPSRGASTNRRLSVQSPASY